MNEQYISSKTFKILTREDYISKYTNKSNEITCYKTGAIVRISPEDFERVTQWSWVVEPLHRGTRFQVSARTLQGSPRRPAKYQNSCYLHRLILNVSEAPLKQLKQAVDHINGDTLDNRRENLRLCSSRENSRNCKLSKNTTSGFKGVHFQPKSNTKKPWMASICYNKKGIYLGYFSTALEAAKAYDTKALELYGEFAKTNKALQLY